MGNLGKTLSDLDRATTDGIASGGLDIGNVGMLLNVYLSQCQELPYTDPDTIKYAQNVLGRAIITHAYFSSPVYKGKIKPEDLHKPDCLIRVAKSFYMSKPDLMDKENWYTGSFESLDTKTSGSTGEPFKYRIWKHGHAFIEQDLHYHMILKEFGIQDPNVLYVENLAPVNYKKVVHKTATIGLAEKDDIKNEYARQFCSHGGNGFFANIKYDSDMFLVMQDFCDYVVDYVRKNNINLLMSVGSFWELLTTYLIADENVSFPKLFNLISNTGDRASDETLEFLKETGVTKNWCNHMRCWDGGVSFFTCKNGTYHTQDELAYSFQDPDGKLCSVDFMSYPAPFINYINGDFCSVGEDWKKCDCGRWHRDFVFKNRKMMTLSDQNGGYYNTQEVVKMLLGKYKLGFFSVQDGSVSIEDSSLTPEEKKQIVSDLARIYVMANFFTNAALQSPTWGRKPILDEYGNTVMHIFATGSKGATVTSQGIPTFPQMSDLSPDQSGQDLQV
jgi:hypothetical protein